MSGTSQEKRKRFADAKLQGMFERMLALAADQTSELYLNGKQRRLAGHRAAFWDGFNGMTLTGVRRSPHVVPRTLSHACWAAGQEFARRQRKTGVL